MDNLLLKMGKKKVHTFYGEEGSREGGIQMTWYGRKQNETKKAKLTQGRCFNRFGCG